MREEELRESFEDFINGINDHRVDRNKLHSVEEILFLTLTAIICGAEGWRDIERFGRLKLEFLRTVFPYANGIPSDDTLRRFFRVLDPKTFSTCFTVWASSLKLPSSTHIAIDGKVSRHTFDGDKNPLHMVSAFASECRTVLAQEKVSDKSNEITAIPKLLGILDIKGAIVTIDAMGCQREIAQAIIDKEADYILSLKGNQGNLHQDIKLVFADKELLNELSVDINQTTDGSEHGRIEERIYRAVTMPQELQEQHNWPELKTIIEVISKREIKGVLSEETRYYISSLEQEAVKIGMAIRSHWAIENSVHWILDVSFRDDDSRIRKGNAPQNIAIIKHMALNVLQKAKQKRDSIKQLRKAAGWDNNQLLTILQYI
ncbi:ISAs1 family transposase [Candidatus Tisiphia endosymbiont of Beris chalybata]|uniref:ISAs1 family transposase n=2 Tax=Candidatus Tisiphia endosymbiont of Beris chalybata TaxID=3066262 RepID=UPI00312CB7D5